MFGHTTDLGMFSTLLLRGQLCAHLFQLVRLTPKALRRGCHLGLARARALLRRSQLLLTIHQLAPSSGEQRSRLVELATELGVLEEEEKKVKILTE